MDSNGNALQAILFKINTEQISIVIFFSNSAYETKAKQADQVNQKLIAKYDNLQKYIKLS